MRVQAEILDALNIWAADDLRSLNSQIEFVLRDELYKAGRLKKASVEPIPDRNSED